MLFLYFQKTTINEILKNISKNSMKLYLFGHIDSHKVKMLTFQMKHDFDEWGKLCKIMELLLKNFIEIPCIDIYDYFTIRNKHNYIYVIYFIDCNL